MQIADLLSPEGVVLSLKSKDKKHLLQFLADRASPLVQAQGARILETLIERERLGTTGVGQGIAIPHGRLHDIKKITGIFARLETPIEYEAVDNQPVDLVFMLMAPEGAGADHLKALARVSRLLRNQTVCEKLRKATTAEALYAILTEPPAASSVAA
jgi:nitrogen PTS system EIIA component